MARFPTRTLVLMTLALFAFVWFWWRTHQNAAPKQPDQTQPISLVPVTVLMDGGVAP
ncbi:MAG: hypothetical protein QM817_10090 [Archangium sp.]